MAIGVTLLQVVVRLVTFLCIVPTESLCPEDAGEVRQAAVQGISERFERECGTALPKRWGEVAGVVAVDKPGGVCELTVSGLGSFSVSFDLLEDREETGDSRDVVPESESETGQSPPHPSISLTNPRVLRPLSNSPVASGDFRLLCGLTEEQQVHLPALPPVIPRLLIDQMNIVRRKRCAIFDFKGDGERGVFLPFSSIRLLSTRARAVSTSVVEQALVLSFSVPVSVGEGGQWEEIRVKAEASVDPRDPKWAVLGGSDGGVRGAEEWSRLSSQVLFLGSDPHPCALGGSWGMDVEVDVEKGREGGSGGRAVHPPLEEEEERRAGGGEGNSTSRLEGEGGGATLLSQEIRERASASSSAVSSVRVLSRWDLQEDAQRERRSLWGSGKKPAPSLVSADIGLQRGDGESSIPVSLSDKDKIKETAGSPDASMRERLEKGSEERGRGGQEAKEEGEEIDRDRVRLLTGDRSKENFFPFLDWSLVRAESAALVRSVEAEVQAEAVKGRGKVGVSEGTRSRGKGPALPATFDFRSEFRSCVSPPREQNTCGACWAFGALGSFEKQICKRSGGTTRVDLSREHVVRCASEAFGCEGGWVDAAFQALRRQGGALRESCIPYSVGKAPIDNNGQPMGSGFCPKASLLQTERPDACRDRFGNQPPRSDDDFRALVTVEWLKYRQREPSDSQIFTLMKTWRGYFEGQLTHTVTGERAIQAAIWRYGAVAAFMDVYNDFLDYRGGVYSHREGSGEVMGSHIVQLIGWGVDRDTRVPFWIAENSWGDQWGEDESFRRCENQKCEGDFCAASMASIGRWVRRRGDGNSTVVQKSPFGSSFLGGLRERGEGAQVCGYFRIRRGGGDGIGIETAVSYGLADMETVKASKRECVLSEWSKWSACDAAACQSGSQTRTRQPRDASTGTLLTADEAAELCGATSEKKSCFGDGWCSGSKARSFIFYGDHVRADEVMRTGKLIRENWVSSAVLSCGEREGLLPQSWSGFRAFVVDGFFYVPEAGVYTVHMSTDRGTGAVVLRSGVTEVSLELRGDRREANAGTAFASLPKGYVKTKVSLLEQKDSGTGGKGGCGAYRVELSKGCDLCPQGYTSVGRLMGPCERLCGCSASSDSCKYCCQYDSEENVCLYTQRQEPRGICKLAAQSGSSPHFALFQPSQERDNGTALAPSQEGSREVTAPTSSLSSSSSPSFLVSALLSPVSWLWRWKWGTSDASEGSASSAVEQGAGREQKKEKDGSLHSDLLRTKGGTPPLPPWELPRLEARKSYGGRGGGDKREEQKQEFGEQDFNIRLYANTEGEQGGVVQDGDEEVGVHENRCRSREFRLLIHAVKDESGLSPSAALGGVAFLESQEGGGFGRVVPSAVRVGGGLVEVGSEGGGVESLLVKEGDESTAGSLAEFVGFESGWLLFSFDRVVSVDAYTLVTSGPRGGGGGGKASEEGEEKGGDVEGPDGMGVSGSEASSSSAWMEGSGDPVSWSLETAGEGGEFLTCDERLGLVPPLGRGRLYGLFRPSTSGLPETMVSLPPVLPPLSSSTEDESGDSGMFSEPPGDGNEETKEKDLQVKPSPSPPPESLKDLPPSPLPPKLPPSNSGSLSPSPSPVPFIPQLPLPLPGFSDGTLLETGRGSRREEGGGEEADGAVGPSEAFRDVSKTFDPQRKSTDALMDGSRGRLQEERERPGGLSWAPFPSPSFLQMSAVLETQRSQSEEAKKKRKVKRNKGHTSSQGLSPAQVLLQEQRTETVVSASAEGKTQTGSQSSAETVTEVSTQSLNPVAFLQFFRNTHELSGAVGGGIPAGSPFSQWPEKSVRDRLKAHDFAFWTELREIGREEEGDGVSMSTVDFSSLFGSLQGVIEREWGNGTGVPLNETDTPSSGNTPGKSCRADLMGTFPAPPMAGEYTVEVVVHNAAVARVAVEGGGVSVMASESLCGTSAWQQSGMEFCQKWAERGLCVDSPAGQKNGTEEKEGDGGWGWWMRSECPQACGVCTTGDLLISPVGRFSEPNAQVNFILQSVGECLETTETGGIRFALPRVSVHLLPHQSLDLSLVTRVDSSTFPFVLIDSRQSLHQNLTAGEGGGSHDTAAVTEEGESVEAAGVSVGWPGATGDPLLLEAGRPVRLGEARVGQISLSGSFDMQTAVRLLRPSERGACAGLVLGSEVTVSISLCFLNCEEEENRQGGCAPRVSFDVLGSDEKPLGEGTEGGHWEHPVSLLEPSELRLEREVKGHTEGQGKAHEENSRGGCVISGFYRPSRPASAFPGSGGAGLPSGSSDGGSPSFFDSEGEGEDTDTGLQWSLVGRVEIPPWRGEEGKLTGGVDRSLFVKHLQEDRASSPSPSSVSSSSSSFLLEREGDKQRDLTQILCGVTDGGVSVSAEQPFMGALFFDLEIETFEL
uniref:Peptidase C1A papain C-terminal domain-containing protein n=1 Tax=Chromera velia CCMP2878 TaxID=1169474 RepID=A0A0G4H6E6_9ALVE|eukprot:Cvel_5750.t1-p1 / transcript=Cvel_5750.t1 / gene=Cvel_5750 / organism=Chromera_velia_CCMP2878 / gene_product=Cathepsin B-like cysteine proteinase, putative / transcript_product=Cathepsin B-like cysteine proteinase, putative / location=Cvel_scaffold273:9810-25275(-) / protein_length=2385 / sequence_SO=supercontig / SO=protein_coding / is_pseudo=false